MFVSVFLTQHLYDGTHENFWQAEIVYGLMAEALAQYYTKS